MLPSNKAAISIIICFIILLLLYSEIRKGIKSLQYSEVLLMSRLCYLLHTFTLIPRCSQDIKFSTALLKKNADVEDFDTE